MAATKHTNTTGQLNLLDLLKPPPPQGPFTCEWCGAVNEHLTYHSINHGRMGRAMCVSMQLTRTHALQAIRDLDPDARSRQQCFHHPSRRKPCPKKCWETYAAEETAIANKVWGSKAWATYED